MVVSSKDLGTKTKIGDGAQGIVYEIDGPAAKLFSFPVVYKEFKESCSVTPHLLENLITFRDGLDTKKREFLDEHATWPIAAVKEDNRITGYLMQRIPADFFIGLNSPSGFKSIPFELQLLRKSDQTFLDDHSFFVSPAERVKIAFELARIYNFLHNNQFIYGDLNWRNAICSRTSGGRIILLDCDGIRKRGSSAPSEQMHSPQWTPPGLTSVQSVQTDCYKLALAILRILSPGLNGQMQGDNEAHFKILSKVASRDLVNLLKGALNPSTNRKNIPEAAEFLRQLKAEKPPLRKKPKVRKQAKKQATRASSTPRTAKSYSRPRASSVSVSPKRSRLSGCGGCIAVVIGLFLLLIVLFGGTEYYKSDSRNKPVLKQKSNTEVTKKVGAVGAPMTTQHFPVVMELTDRRGRPMHATIFALGSLNVVAADSNGEVFVIPIQTLSSSTRLKLVPLEQISTRGSLQSSREVRPWFLEFRGKSRFAGKESITVKIEKLHDTGDVSVLYNGKSVDVSKSLLSDETISRLDEYRYMLGM